MRRPLRALACAALCAALSGCTTLSLPNRFTVADEGWTGTFRLQIGDVVYLTISVKGKSLFSSGALALGNPYPLWSDSERIPLRLASDTLTADEANLLMGFLASGLKSPPIDASLEQEIEKARLELWSALVRSLMLSRLQENQPAQLQVRMAEVAGEDHGFCFRLQSIGGASAEFFFKDECAGDLQQLSDIDIRYIRALRNPLSAITENRTNIESPQYQGNKQVAISVARVERRGAAMHNKYGQEARWSLADWQNSGICVDQQGIPLHIIAVTLRTERFRQLRVMPEHAAARFDIRLFPLGSRTPTLDADAAVETLTQASLKFLTPGDVTAVYWGRPPTQSPAPVPVELAFLSRDPCNP